MKVLTMRTKIRRCGHSLAVRIPKPFAIEARLGDQTEVDLVVVDGENRRYPGDEIGSAPQGSPLAGHQAQSPR